MKSSRLRNSLISMSSIIGLLIGASSAIPSPYVTQTTTENITDEPVYSPYVGRAYSDRVFFGDMHFHTELSFDAGLIGTTYTRCPRWL